jgi:hypothetical protein
MSVMVCKHVKFRMFDVGLETLDMDWRSASPPLYSGFDFKIWNLHLDLNGIRVPWLKTLPTS